MTSTHISFYPLDAEHLIEGTSSFILLFGRDHNSERLCVKLPFQSYVWVVPRENERKEDLLTQLSRHQEEFTITAILEEKREYTGVLKTVFKICVQTPDMVAPLRTVLRDTNSAFFEADILFVRRFLIDNDITFFDEYKVTGEFTKPLSRSRCLLATSIERGETTYETKLRVLAFDIETYPDETKGTENAILMVAFVGDNFHKVITWKRFSNTNQNIEIVQGEAELIERIKEVIDDYQPDIITGYSSDGFDLPFIHARAQKYKIKLDFGIDRSELHFGKGRREDVQITGITHFDVYALTRNVLSQSLKTESYTLDAVAKELIGEQKKKLNIVDLAPAWDTNNRELIEQFCEYNLQDSELTYKLAIKLLPTLIEMVRIVGLPAFDVSRLPMSQMVEWFLIKNAAKQKILIPNKPEHDEIKERSLRAIQGAFVFEPQPGLYKEIIVFDFRSLYPTIIASHNLSGETFRCSCCRFTGPRVPLEGEELWFCQKRKGFLARMIEELITRRIRLKEILKEQDTPILHARQLGLKLLANSFYGYLAFEVSRWYSFEAANSTTAYARHYIKNSIHRMQQAGFRVIYSDTDSIFITIDACQKKEDALAVMAELNKGLPRLMELEFQGQYPAGIFVSVKDKKDNTKEGSGAKKRYALIDQHDRLIIKGFESIRRNTAVIAKEAQQKVLTIILKEQNPEKAFNYITDLLKKIQGGEIAVDKFIIRTRISRDLESYAAVGPHVHIARRMKASGKAIGVGSVISYVIKKGEGIIRDRADIPENVQQQDIDAEYYIHNQVIPAVERIFEVFGYCVQEEVAPPRSTKDADAKDQQTLKKFFSD